MEIKRSVLFFVAFASLFVLISLVQNTYAKYTSSATADTEMSIAKWNILVNNSDIINNSDFSNTIQPVFPGSTHISSDIIAPLSEGYFDILIDYTNVDVSFDQTIKLSHSASNTIDDLVITGYSINSGVVTAVGDTSAQITSTVLLSEVSRTKTYRIYVKWIDGAGEQMDNAADTAATKTGKASIKVSLSFVQKPS